MKVMFFILWCVGVVDLANLEQGSGTVDAPTRIVANNFGQHHWALNYTGSLALTDVQERANNTWDRAYYNGSTTRFAARHQGAALQGVLPGTFKADRNSTELPPNFAPFQTGANDMQWFINQ